MSGFEPIGSGGGGSDFTTGSDSVVYSTSTEWIDAIDLDAIPVGEAWLVEGHVFMAADNGSLAYVGVAQFRFVVRNRGGSVSSSTVGVLSSNTSGSPALQLDSTALSAGNVVLQSRMGVAAPCNREWSYKVTILELP